MYIYKRNEDYIIKQVHSPTAQIICEIKIFLIVSLNYFLYSKALMRSLFFVSNIKKKNSQYEIQFKLYGLRESFFTHHKRPQYYDDDKGIKNGSGQVPDSQLLWFHRIYSYIYICIVFNFNFSIMSGNERNFCAVYTNTHYSMKS